MKAWPLLLVPFLVGCGNGGTAKAPNSEVAKKEEPIAAPDSPKPSRLFMVGSDSLLRLGDDWGDAQKVFPAPKGSFPITDLPDRFSPPYTARGWEATRDGFGVILYDERIVEAMLQNERSDTVFADDLRRRYDNELTSLTPVEVKSATANFVFWEDGDQRLMLLVQKLSDKVRTTVALGDKKVMDAIGASTERARQDGQQLDALLKEGKGNGGTKPGVEESVPKGQGGGVN